jgi:hypothetical protein
MEQAAEPSQRISSSNDQQQNEDVYDFDRDIQQKSKQELKILKGGFDTND